jgi:hypothetical protein
METVGTILVKLIDQSPAIAGMVILAGGFLYFMWKMSSRAADRDTARDQVLREIEQNCHESTENLAAKYDVALDQTTKKYEAALEKVVSALAQNTLACYMIAHGSPRSPRPPGPESPPDQVTPDPLQK